jgi:protein-S-isoprenylcysteine O-methyltransferase Ste14
MRTHGLELRVPPPVVALILAACAWALADGPLAWHAGVGFLLGLGLAIDASALWAFWRHRTTINPLHPERTTALVSGGIYRHTRNPMYLGLVCLLLAWAWALGHVWALLAPLVFVSYITRFQIVPEERAMAAHFGAAYDDYRQRVRRWL